MGRGKASKVEKGVSGVSFSNEASSSGVLGLSSVPLGPVFHPSEEEFEDPLEYIDKIRSVAEPYGICKIVPPPSWKPPFALDMDKFTFPTKSQSIHQLQARCAPCDPKTFGLDYGRFLEEHCGKKAKKRIVFDGEDLDLCKLFNAVKRFGGYEKVAKAKKWGEVFKFVRPGHKVSQCSKHVLSLLYLEYLLDYEEYHNTLNVQKTKSAKVCLSGGEKCDVEVEGSSYKRRRKNKEGDRVEIRKVEEEELDQICEQCKSGLHGEVMLLCDRCNKGWHIYCLSPPLKRIPPGNWYCIDCLNSEKDSFGFVQGKEISLEAFRRVAERIKKRWTGSGATSLVQLEKKFWEIVEGAIGEVDVKYGSDLDTSVYGSGFPRKDDEKLDSVDVHTWNEYCNSPWNLNNLPKLQGSVLRTVHQNIAGVMVPWLYVGMLFSAFCWHFEDHCFYSMNYLHWGEPKCWYSVPGNKADAFEKVMRNTLPDLFEAQPDLLFQLVTMLNPAVLQEKGVPVYNIIQEPGNFVITFPRSYHGGFNLGLNCAEAVNFAPADWLPHGGFGSELYRKYHKVPVISHEELLCVVAKQCELDNRVSFYLKEELVRMFVNEKTWRERLWKNGVVRSRPMLPRAKSEYVGTEEDPMCIICKHLLYLSAVSCKCRPSAFVCLEHWEHLCECKPTSLRLFYRHSLGELSGLLLKLDISYSTEATGASQKDIFHEKGVSVAKKVNGTHVTHLQLAQDWILRSCKILELPYSKNAYANAIKEAEEYLWAGSEMDVVREVLNNLIQSKNWAEAVKDHLSKIKSWRYNRKYDTGRVEMDSINELLSLSVLPCNEPSHVQLKAFHEEAYQLIQEINAVMAPNAEVSVDDLEILYTKAVESPIHVNESEKLKLKLLATKTWVADVRKCLSQKAPSSVEVDILYKLEAEISELHLKLPEADLLIDLLRQVKSCRSQCNEILKDSLHLKDIKPILTEWKDFAVNIPELELMKKHHGDTLSWMSRVDLVLSHVNEREDQENVVNELTCIQREGSLLQIQDVVDELPRVGLELEKARCRVKAFKALHSAMSMDSVNQLISEAIILHIEKEKVFTDISQRHADAVLWEDRAKIILATKAHMSEVEDILRGSEHIGIILPSLPAVKHEASVAKAWLIKAKPFLSQDRSLRVSDSCLKVDLLKELVSESVHLKIYLEEMSLLQQLWNKCLEWVEHARSLLQDAVKIWHANLSDEGITSSFTSRLECLLHSMDTAMKTGISLGLEFDEIPELRDACSALNWSIKALLFLAVVPSHEEVELIMNAAADLHLTYKSSGLWTGLIDGLRWLKKSLQILDPSSLGGFEVNSVEEELVLSKELFLSFPMVTTRLQDAMENHYLWLEQVHKFFGLDVEVRSWDTLLQLRDQGISGAFACEERRKVLVEVEKLQEWRKRCENIIKPPSTAEDNLLLSNLHQINDGLARSFHTCSLSDDDKGLQSCICCFGAVEGLEHKTCCLCQNRFHLQCAKPPSAESTSSVCPYCYLMNKTKPPHSGVIYLKTRIKQHVELDKLLNLLSEANDLCLWTDERRTLQLIVEQALACNTCLTKLVDLALAYVGKDLNAITRKLYIGLKAVEVAGVCDTKALHRFEMVLVRNWWKIKARELLESSEKPTIQHIQHHLKQGLAMSIPPEDYYWKKLTELRDMGLQWADTAKKVSEDGGALALDKVFELISEGENLPVLCGRELKLLRDRSMLYCICRRPYDQRAMIACDKCDEWYHFDCMKISSVPKAYVCPACDLQDKQQLCAIITKPVEPRTPLRRSESRRKSQKALANECYYNNNSSNNIERLLWRNKKPFNRVVRKRLELQYLSPLFHV